MSENVADIGVEDGVLQDEPADQEDEEENAANGTGHFSIVRSEILESGVDVQQRCNGRPHGVDRYAVVHQNALQTDFRVNDVFFIGIYHAPHTEMDIVSNNKNRFEMIQTFE